MPMALKGSQRGDTATGPGGSATGCPTSWLDVGDDTSARTTMATKLTKGRIDLPQDFTPDSPTTGTSTMVQLQTGGCRGH